MFIENCDFFIKTHLCYTHYFAIKVFNRHAQQTMRFVSGTGIDVMVEPRILEEINTIESLNKRIIIL